MSRYGSKRNSLLDLLRFISCLFVVLIHCPLPGFLGTAIITFGRYAVPFFLMISGYYLFSDNRNVVLRKAKNIINLLYNAEVEYENDAVEQDLLCEFGDIEDMCIEGLVNDELFDEMCQDFDEEEEEDE